MIGTLAMIVVIGCVFALIWVGVSTAIDKGFAVLNQQRELTTMRKEIAKLVKPKKTIKPEVDWAKMVEGAAKPKPKPKSQPKKKFLDTPPGAKKFNTLPPGAKKLDI